jgi:hypothetical protein
VGRSGDAAEIGAALGSVRRSETVLGNNIGNPDPPSRRRSGAASVVFAPGWTGDPAYRQWHDETLDVRTERSASSTNTSAVAVIEGGITAWTCERIDELGRGRRAG